MSLGNFKFSVFLHDTTTLEFPQENAFHCLRLKLSVVAWIERGFYRPIGLSSISSN